MNYTKSIEETHMKNSTETTCFDLLKKFSQDCRCANKNCKFNFASSQKSCLLVQFLDSENENLSLQELGDIFNISRMRVCQIEKGIIRKIVSEENTQD
jgi:DNA-directed RNA polymerase sigma subunit (sigma70/sigma32)